ncbi:CocE/NonD family hydrolase [Kaistella flava (ex Peng et al. 2021)]|uniref:CocE/NonD family hydrolase n=1 Tax=Kaistella flava (ex Peng et al. 2021) TaxID=2038776 RepID=A0A7M2Y893_9FLAO|nr:CocE/NonD family hydrolase [Kaistella flava (ex Peng et al. 2021)]QOW09845.1 CocE/NonD family hydrolase [Kaistella flava (ex Peng et al. 2021)]
MKQYFSFFLILFYSLSFSQKISIKQFEKIDFNQIESLVQYLSSQIPQKYDEKDKATYYDNIFRISMAAGKYETAMKQLDSVKSIFMESNPTIANAMGTQHEIYIKTIVNPNSKNNFEKIYKNEFKKKYEELSLKSQISLPVYFKGDSDQIKKGVVDLLQKEFVGKDSVNVNTALELCRDYNGYIVVKKSFHLANQYLKEFDAENFTVKDSILIKNKSNSNISIRVVLNNKIKKPESTIIINTIYADENDINDAKVKASYGYNCVYIYTRGKHLSNHKIEPFEHEQEDINEVINWIIKQPWSNGKVGMIGGSYLGFSQWAAAKKLHPALKTIIPQASVGIGSMDFPMNNNVFGTYSLRWLNYVTNNKTTDAENFRNEEKWNSVYKKWYVSGVPFNKLDSISGNRNEIFQRWLQHPNYDQFWKNMVPYKEEFSKINIPILTITGYYDSDQLGALYYFRNHKKYNKNANHYLIIGPYDHSGAQGYIKNELLGYKIDPIAEINLTEICMEWFDYVLKEKNKPTFLKDKINYHVMGTNEWKHSSSIEQFDEHQLKFYFQKHNNQFVLSQSNSKKREFSRLNINFEDRSDADELIKQEFNIIKSSIYNNNNLTFSTDTFDEPFEFSGNFSGTFRISVNKRDVDLNVKLYEVLPDGKHFLLSSYLGRASYSQNPEKRMLLTPNKKATIQIKNNEFVSKKIEKGSRLFAVIGVNKNPFWQINYGSGKEVSEESIEDAKEPLEIKFYNDSYIKIPISQN